MWSTLAYIGLYPIFLPTDFMGSLLQTWLIAATEGQAGDYRLESPHPKWEQLPDMEHKRVWADASKSKLSEFSRS